MTLSQAPSGFLTRMQRSVVWGTPEGTLCTAPGVSVQLSSDTVTWVLSLGSGVVWELPGLPSPVVWPGDSPTVESWALVGLPVFPLSGISPFHCLMPSVLTAAV